ncbi:hypothetical protein J3F84DRAFT_347166 [Trichoderma pleuroticola]
MNNVLYIRKMLPANIAATAETEKRDGIDATAANISRHSVIEAENRHGIDIVTDDDREHWKIHLGGTTAAIEIEAGGGIDTETAVAIVGENDRQRQKIHLAEAHPRQR